MDRNLQWGRCRPSPRGLRAPWLSVVSWLAIGGFCLFGHFAVGEWNHVAEAQELSAGDFPPTGKAPTLSFGSEFGMGLAGPDSDNENPRHIRFEAEFKTREGTRDGLLSIRADLDSNWYTYSITQKEGGPQRSRLQVTSDAVELREDFVADRTPRLEEYVFWDVPSEEHDEQVIWTAPVRFTEGVAIESLVIVIRFDGQICQKNGTCIPLENVLIEARHGGTTDSLDVAGPGVVPSKSESRFASSDITFSGLIIATLTLLVGIWFGCWMIGRIP